DNASSSFGTFQLLRGSSDFDVRHNLQGALTYEVPGTYTNPVVSAILKHWAFDVRVSARSAFPVNILGPFSFDPSSGQRIYFQPNFVSGQPLYLYGSQYPGGRIINFQAFQAAPPGTQGNVPRNNARGFGAFQADLAIRREFRIREPLRLQLRAEAFNVFNHPNFAAITNTLSSGPKAFGYATNTLNNSLSGLNALYQLGGPRSLQVALKLLF
ncbi:MAG TPA: TonB-dependent receptor, partial [Candidatus Dormibacteraeota bacterium]|nr:TonB-dependent receptor [Candidatus Dormibacteraeota bacterium]